MVELRKIRNSRDLKKIGLMPFLNFINELTREKAMLLVDTELTIKQEEEWLKNQAKDIDSGNIIQFVLFVDGKLAGNCEARRGKLKEKYNVHFGIAILKLHRGKGYGERMLKKCMEEAMERFKPHKMWIEHLDGNEPASALYKKLGFVEIARLNEYTNHFGEWRDKVLMEWRG